MTVTQAVFRYHKLPEWYKQPWTLERSAQIWFEVTKASGEILVPYRWKLQLLANKTTLEALSTWCSYKLKMTLCNLDLQQDNTIPNDYYTFRYNRGAKLE